MMVFQIDILRTSNFKSFRPFDRDINHKKITLTGTAIEVFITVYS